MTHSVWNASTCLKMPSKRPAKRAERNEGQSYWQPQITAGDAIAHRQEVTRATDTASPDKNPSSGPVVTP